MRIISFKAVFFLFFFFVLCTEPLQSLKAIVEFLNHTLITAYKANTHQITGKYTHLCIQAVEAYGSIERPKPFLPCIVFRFRVQIHLSGWNWVDRSLCCFQCLDLSALNLK